MPYKRIKDESKLIAKYKLKTGKKHYWHVFLWENQESFDTNTNDNTPYTTAGCVNFASTRIWISEDGSETILDPKPKLGEIHFISGRWTTEIVAHELCHAILHRMRVLSPSAQDVMEQKTDSEEDVCYEFGFWMGELYRHLWKDDPESPQHKKKDPKKEILNKWTTRCALF